jgi:hypothetical protein
MRSSILDRRPAGGPLRRSREAESVEGGDETTGDIRDWRRTHQPFDASTSQHRNRSVLHQLGFGGSAFAENWYWPSGPKLKVVLGPQGPPCSSAPGGSGRGVRACDSATASALLASFYWNSSGRPFLPAAPNSHPSRVKGARESGADDPARHVTFSS